MGIRTLDQLKNNFESTATPTGRDYDPGHHTSPIDSDFEDLIDTLNTNTYGLRLTGSLPAHASNTFWDFAEQMTSDVDTMTIRVSAINNPVVILVDVGSDIIIHTPDPLKNTIFHFNLGSLDPSVVDVCTAINNANPFSSTDYTVTTGTGGDAGKSLITFNTSRESLNNWDSGIIETSLGSSAGTYFKWIRTGLIKSETNSFPDLVSFDLRYDIPNIFNAPVIYGHPTGKYIMGVHFEAHAADIPITTPVVLSMNTIGSEGNYGTLLSNTGKGPSFLSISDIFDDGGGNQDWVIGSSTVFCDETVVTPYRPLIIKYDSNSNIPSFRLSISIQKINI